jgi:hypothetical protein
MTMKATILSATVSLVCKRLSVCAPLLTWPTHLQLHTYLAQNVLGKPLVIEEFGLTWFKKTPAQQRVLFQVK